MYGLGKSALARAHARRGFASPPRHSRRPARSTRARPTRLRAPISTSRRPLPLRPSRKTQSMRLRDAVKLLQEGDLKKNPVGTRHGPRQDLRALDGAAQDGERQDDARRRSAS